MKRCIAIILTVLAVAGTGVSAEVIKWSDLPDLPDVLGVAGAFSGVSSGALILAGGADFPEPFFKNYQVNSLAKKVWRDNVYVLTDPGGQWQRAGGLVVIIDMGCQAENRIRQAQSCRSARRTKTGLWSVCPAVSGDHALVERAIGAARNQSAVHRESFGPARKTFNKTPPPGL